jgi:HlyD family secretion protein
MNKIKHYLKNKYVISLIVLAFVLAGVTYAQVSKDNSAFETAKAEIKTVTESVNVTGKVAPFEKSDLGFEKGGTIASINVRVGDHVRRGALIASLKDSQTLASLLGAEANLAAAEANLSDDNTNTQIDFVNAQREAINSNRDAYVSVNNAILNDVGTFFLNGASVNPTLDITVSSYAAQRILENKRIEVTDVLKKWKADTDLSQNPENAAQLIASARVYLTTIKSFMSLLSSAVLDLSNNTTGLTAAEITAMVSTLNSANAEINTAVSSVTTAENALNSAKPKSVKLLQAKIEQARADVANYQAQYAKSRITAPFDGVVTVVEPHLGDVVSAGDVVFSMIADRSFKVEVNVPEAEIAKIKEDNKATITLDAYTEDVVFPATVISIDPAETIVEGIPTYKVTLQFDQKDERIRSGMTANIHIITATKADVVAVPLRAIIDSNGKKVVRVVNADGKTFTEVEIAPGLRGSDGMVEIMSGLSTGTTVVTSVK